MKILYPKEYIEENGQTSLREYMEYLELSQLEADDVLKSAVEFSLTDEVIQDINSQLKEIEYILALIEKYMYNIVLNSIDKMSLEELHSYFTEQEKDIEDRLTQEQGRLASVTRELEELDRHIQDSRDLDEDFLRLFKSDDVRDFFEPITKEEYISGLMSGEYPNDANTFQNAIKSVLSFLDIEIGNDQLHAVATKMVNKLYKSKKILDYSKKSQSQLIAKLVDSEELNPTIQDSGVDIKVDIVQELIDQRRKKTSFFRVLPDSMRSELESERLSGDAYKKLQETYEIVKTGGALPSRVSESDLDKKETLTKKKSEIEATISGLQAELREFKTTDGTAMRNRLKSIILSSVGSQVSMEKVSAAIEAADIKTEEMRDYLETIADGIAAKKTTLSEIDSILGDSENEAFFKDAEKVATARICKWLNIDYSEASVEPLVEAEKKRLEQIRLLMNIQSSLEDLNDSYTELNSKHNFLTKHFASYKDEKEDLDTDYRTIIEDGFKELQEKGLLQIEISNAQISNDGGTILGRLPGTATVMATSFDDVFLIDQKFWDFSTGLDEETERQVAAANEMDDWKQSSETLMQMQRIMFKNLFSHTKNAEGHYVFKMTPEDRTNLFRLQERIVAITESIYEAYKNRRLDLARAEANFKEDADLKQRISRLVGSDRDLSKRSLEEVKSELSEEIASLTTILQRHKRQCDALGIEVESDPTVEDESTDLNADIVALGIEGMTTLEEAKLYRSVLTNLGSFTIPADEVKTFYLKSIKKN